jgi:hypothetical protein
MDDQFMRTYESAKDIGSIITLHSFDAKWHGWICFFNGHWNVRERYIIEKDFDINGDGQ